MAAEARGRHVLFYGLEVKDDVLYRRYRERMTPILHRYGGRFGFDLEVSRVLQREAEGRINRAFTMIFADPAAAERFFADAEYRAVRAELFAPAVGDVTRIGAYTEEPSPEAATAGASPRGR
jgi:uncharacterized protein (DUF1330 family)